MTFQSAVAVVCRPNGVITTVLHDDLGVASCFPPGSSLGAVVETASVGEAERLLREIRESSFALDVKLQLRCGDMSIPLLVSGYATAWGIYLIGSKQSLSRESLIHEMLRQTQEKESTLPHTALLALTAHDFRNHLNGILAANQYLLDDAAASLDPEHVTLLRSIESSGREMFRVLDDIMQVTVLDSANQALDLKPTDVAAAVRKSVSANRGRAERKKVRLELTAPAAVPFIAADPASMARVIDSLLVSVIDSEAPGGRIEVSFGTEDLRALVSVRVENSNVSVEQLRSILDPRHPDVEGVKAGIILALRVMKRIVEEHGGSSEVAAATSRNWTIMLALPISGEAPMRSQGA